MATETSLHRRVVIKVVSIDGGATDVERFRREILTAASLTHPHIVPVLAAGEADGQPWFAMPLMTGESLRARLANGGALFGGRGGKAAARRGAGAGLRARAGVRAP